MSDTAAIAIITGSSGLIGAAAGRRFAAAGVKVVGVDNDQRQELFGREASTAGQRQKLEASLGNNYSHAAIDIRDQEAVDRLFAEHGHDIALVVHTAAQPSHDWSAKDPCTDFAINATGTLNLLEATRCHAPNAVFLFTSTNKVYGDTPNKLPIVEQAKRYDLPLGSPDYRGIDETMSIDHCKHSPFGASKLAADIMVQEYGRYFGLQTVSLRCGCLTGPGHAAVQLHGFLAHLVGTAVREQGYTIFGYQGKQVRDNLHAEDLAAAMECLYRDPPDPGSVFNLGGGRENSCSILEAIDQVNSITGKRLQTTYVDQPRSGDHQWYISNLTRFQERYPDWKINKSLTDILQEIEQCLLAPGGSRGRDDQHDSRKAA